MREEIDCHRNKLFPRKEKGRRVEMGGGKFLRNNNHDTKISSRNSRFWRATYRRVFVRR
jgi:hypothetical protein